VTDTLAWLGLLNLPLAGVHLLTNQEPKSLVEPQCDLYLDDKPNNVYDLRAFTHARLVCLMRRPWNVNCAPLTDGMAIVSNWKEFVEIAERMC
jgi:hypothetical protein